MAKKSKFSFFVKIDKMKICFREVKTWVMFIKEEAQESFIYLVRSFHLSYYYPGVFLFEGKRGGCPMVFPSIFSDKR
jgi:hypothetical protein